MGKTGIHPRATRHQGPQIVHSNCDTVRVYVSWLSFLSNTHYSLSTAKVSCSRVYYLKVMNEAALFHFARLFQG